MTTNPTIAYFIGCVLGVVMGYVVGKQWQNT